MKKVIASIVIVLLFSASVLCLEPEGKTTIFIIQLDRNSDTLELDANMILKTIQDAKNGDIVVGMTMDGKQVFKLDVIKKNPLEMKRDKNIAVTSIRQLYLSQISNPTKPSQTDVAGALRRGIQRANSGNNNNILIVFLSGGVHRSQLLDITHGFPSDSFAVSPKSVFSIVPQQALGKRIEVLFVPQTKDFVSPLHGQKLERFYSLLLKKRR